jgi:hypothetical protein
MLGGALRPSFAKLLRASCFAAWVDTSRQPAVAASQLWRGTRFSDAPSRLAAPKRRRLATGGDSNCR